MIDHPSELRELLDEQAVDATRIHRVLATLTDGAWWAPRDLVRATGVPHRLVEATLGALGEDLRCDGGAVRLARPDAYTAFATPRLPDPLAPLLDAHPRAAEELERLVAQAPPSRGDLDHVAATPETALRRAVFLATRFALPGRRLLCVGDHDLTSLAVTLVCPDTEVVVVDIDERVLAHIDAAATRLGLPVRCHFGDLRLGLPPVLRGRCDLAFTDPPYTPEGVELFVRRALAGLADPRRARVLLAYGASSTTPGLAARTQARLTRMQLVFEEIRPGFNRYLGAEAIGAASDLYVLRPTSRTPADDRGGASSGADNTARIYSQGGNAKEATGALDAATAAELLRRRVTESGADTLVGEWPREALATLSDNGGRSRVRLTTWLESPTPAGCAVVNLTGGWEALLDRVILAGSGAETHVVVPSSAPQVRDANGQAALRELVGPRHDLRFLRGEPEPRTTVVVARRRDLPADASPAARLLRHCQERAHGSLAASLREGLIAVAGDLRRPINKKGARTRVAAAAPWAAGHTLLDLPAHRFPELREATRRLVADLP